MVKALIMPCKIELLRTVRNPFFLFFSLCMPVMFYYIFTNIVNADLPDKEIWQTQYLMSMTIFSIISSSISSLGVTEVYEKRSGWTTFVRITPMPALFHMVAKMTAQMFVNFLSVVVIFTFGMLVNHIRLPIVTWISSGLWLLCASLPFLALGTVVGSLKKVNTATVVSNILLFGLAIVGGLWMPVELFPETLQAIAKWLPSYRYGEGAWQIVQGDAIHPQTGLILFFYLVIFVLLSMYIRKRQDAV